MLPEAKYIQGSHPPKLENHEQRPLPQLYADRFGWREMARVVADAYFKIPPGERERCAILGQNYGQAGAIDFFGAKMGLPPALSGHQNYYYWGPRGYTGECIIVMGDRYEALSRKFDSVEKVGTVYHPLSMPYSILTCICADGPSSVACHKSGQSSEIGTSFFPLCWCGSGLCNSLSGVAPLI